MKAGRGRFITLEGIEGVGKSTNLEFVAARVRAAGYSVVTTREPGGTPLAEQIRALLLDKDQSVAPLAEVLMMFAARASHLVEVIEPALARGEWVVCDRFTDASFAYQGGGRGIACSVLESLEAIVQRDLQPDLTLLLDAPLTVSATRQAGRRVADRFESEPGGFFERVRNAYLVRAQADPRRIRVIDASLSLEAVQTEIAATLADLVKGI